MITISINKSWVVRGLASSFGGCFMKKLLLLSVVLLASASNLALAGGLEWLEKADGKEYLFDDGDFRGRGIKVFAKVVKGGYITSNSQLQQLDEIISSRDAVLERLQSAVKALQG